MSVEVSVLIALIGCFVGLAGWLLGRDKKIARDAEWRGTVNGKLDSILGIKEDVKDINVKILDHECRIIKVEDKVSRRKTVKE